MVFLKLTFCSFNVLKAELTFDEKLSALNTPGFPSSVQKNVYGASVIIFEGIMSFADKELLQVRRYFFVFLFEEVLSNVKSNHRRLLPFELLKCIRLKPSEGVCSFHLQLLDMKLFVDTDSDIRLVRRLRRDITERGRDIEGVIKQYNKFVKPAFEQYIEPTMRLADIVVPRGETVGLPRYLTV